MEQLLVLVALTAVLVFMVIYYSTLNRNDDEKFNTSPTPDKSDNPENPVLKVVQEINENVSRFNNETSATTSAITSAFSDVRRNVDAISRDTSTNVRGMRNDILLFQKTLNDMDSQYVKPETLRKYMPETQVRDAIARSDTLLRNDLASRRYVDGEFVPSYKLDELTDQVKKDRERMGLDLTGLNARQTDMQAKMTLDYASRDWAASEFAPAKDMASVRATHDIIFRDFAKVSDLDIHKTGVQSFHNRIVSDMGDLRQHVDVNYVTQVGLKDKLEQQYTPLELHNNMSRVVNDTLVGLNESLMKTIRRDGDAATYTKLVLMEDQVGNMTHAITGVNERVSGITPTTIDRDELVLGKYRLSGVEQGDMIRLFNRDKTAVAGGLAAKGLEAQSSLVSGGTTALRGPVNLGTASNRPILVKGQANVEVNTGSVLLLDKNAQHKVDGTLTVESLNANNLIIGRTVLDPGALDELQSKIKKMEERLDVLSAAKQSEELPVITVYEGVNAKGASDGVRYSVEELDAAWQDRISCIVVSPGVKVTVYAQSGFGGSDTRTIANYRLQPMTVNLMDFPLAGSATKTWDKAVKSIRMEKI